MPRPSAGPVYLQILIPGALHIAISVIIHRAAVFGAAEAVSRLPSRRAIHALDLSAAMLCLLSIRLFQEPAT